MDLNSRIASFVQLGKIFDYLGHSKQWDGHHLGINKEEFEALENSIYKAKQYNGWFDEVFVRLAFKNLSIMLDEAAVRKWVAHYKLNDNYPNKTIAIIMAGNIPLVGFHDLLCVLITGNKALVKLSTDDNILLPHVVDVLCFLHPDFKDNISFASGKLQGFDAVIATGSNNTSRYFEYYFGKYPNIIRKNRTSVAVLNGDETDAQLKALAGDVFSYFGLGCRNVSKVFLPKGYDLDKLFKVFFEYEWVTNNNKYGNNYDYHKALFLMNQEPFTENGFFILKESESLHSPLACLYYEFYEHFEDVEKWLKDYSESIQCIINKGYLELGSSQVPSLFDYPDQVDVVNFLTKNIGVR